MALRYALGMRHIGAVILGLAFLFAVGCGGQISSAQRAYHEGRYLEAAEQLDRCEGELKQLSPEMQANYGLYRGLALIQLGDEQEASRWLEYSAAIEAKQPGTLEPADKRRLTDARASVAKNLAIVKSAATESSAKGPAVNLQSSP